jgi:hypothetical protein
MPSQKMGVEETLHPIGAVHRNQSDDEVRHEFAPEWYEQLQDKGGTSRHEDITHVMEGILAEISC